MDQAQAQTLSGKTTFPDLYEARRRKKVSTVFIIFSLSMFVLGVYLSFMILANINKALILMGLMSYSSLSLMRLLFYTIGASLYKAEKKTIIKTDQLTSFPRISVLVPAYNEGAVIADVVNNYQHIDYPNFEVVIVDDGSKDDTYENALSASLQSPVDIKVYRKTNGGKASALNFALEHSDGEYVLCMDADSTLAPETLRAGVRYFADNEKLGAVAGIVKVENTNSMIGRMQYLDYMFGHFQRKVLSVLKTVTIVPGPIGLFKRAAISEVGGYERENTTFAEDTELTFKILTAGYEIICDDEMVAYTEAPNNYKDLYRQRYRWTRGIYQALLKNTSRFLSVSELRATYTFMYLLWEQVLLPVIDFVMFSMFIICYVIGTEQITYSYLFFYIYVIDILMALMATREEKNRFAWIGYSFLGRFFYSNILLVWKMSAFFDEWSDRGMTWDKLERNGFSGQAQTGVLK